MTSPTFCARFADGTEIRMTVWHSPERGSFDLRRGVRLARLAYATRMHDPFDAPPAVPPMVVARFEDDGVELISYSAQELAEAAR
jgi:hypothetical protein